MLIREKLFGANSPQIVESYRGLGNVYRETKEYEKSLSYYQKALQNKVEQLGDGHKDLARYYTHISEVYYLMENKEQGDFYKAKAEEVLR
jgi:tetratricopeptide (TPR) repeat protein